jgi:8-oxo-dGTP pyrophosphatase MutT (NUDIX family)
MARAWAVAAGGEHVPAAPRDAATVVLLRDLPGSGIEVYLLRRVASMAFAAGMYVFPGGSVDPRDADVELGWAGPSAGDWTGMLAAAEKLARALICAAVRETFEESGVLLAGPSATEIADVSDDSWEADRHALLDRSLSLAQLLSGRNMVLRADLLRPWAHWITPEFEPKRFDTRFFVAALPGGQVPRHVGGEADRVVWIRPEQALAQQVSGAFGLLPPTAVTLTELAEFDCVADILAASVGRHIEPILPRAVITEAGARLVIPGDAGYAE